MTRFFFLLPFLMDFSAGAFGALCVIYSQQQGASYFFLGPLLGSVPPAIYGLSCYLLGKTIRPEQVRRFIIAAIFAGLAMCLVQWAVADYRLTVITLTAFTIALAFFYLPYEILLMQHSSRHDPVRASALYNVAWSLGFGTGSWLGGYLLDISRLVGFAAPVVGILGLLVVLYYYRSMVRAALTCPVSEPVATHPMGPHPSVGAEARPSVRVIEYHLVVGWVCIFTYCFVASYMRTVYIKTADGVLNLSAAQIGGLMGAQVLAISLTSAITYVLPRIAYRKLPVAVAAGVMGLAGILIARVSSFHALTIAFMLVGAYGAFALVTGVTYAGSHPSKRARALSINQTLIGLGYLTGPLITGLGADLDARAGVVIILVVIVAQIAFLTWFLGTQRAESRA